LIASRGVQSAQIRRAACIVRTEEIKHPHPQSTAAARNLTSRTGERGVMILEILSSGLFLVRRGLGTGQTLPRESYRITTNS
jgi:hypothetical protein